MTHTTSRRTKLEEVQMSPRATQPIAHGLRGRTTPRPGEQRALAAHLEVDTKLGGVELDVLDHPWSLQTQRAGEQRLNSHAIASTPRIYGTRRMDMWAVRPAACPQANKARLSASIMNDGFHTKRRRASGGHSGEDDIVRFEDTYGMNYRMSNSKQKIALITGITGQDGAYLAQLLLEKDYIVYGAYRRTSSVNFWRMDELDVQNHKNLHLVEYDLTDLGASIALVQKVMPDEIYNLAAQSFVGVSFEQPSTTAQITGIGALHLLEAIRLVNTKIRFYQASTSEMFGKVQAIPQKEDTPFYPRSPYGVAKLYAHWMTINYRESYNIFGSSGILFNHESPLRGREFVTRKITDSVAKIKHGKLDVLELGNLDARRDWGYAQEYVEGMWRMLQADEPDTFVLATNRTETVREFVRMAFKGVGMTVDFKGTAEKELAIDIVTGRTVMRVNPKFYRPTEVELLIGDPAKAKSKLGWEAQTTLEQLCQMMVDADLRRIQEGFSF